MSARSSSSRSSLYPARYFRASPTYNSWVRLTAAELHALRAEPGFEGQNVLFHLNHPIAFVRITGVITSITDLSANYTLFTIDDSSGRSIEVKISRLAKWIADSPESPSNTAISNVNIRFGLGNFDILIDGLPIDIGTVVSAKGTLDEWRGERQLVLKRVRTINYTAAEVQEWTKMEDFKQRVLNKPWVLDDNAIKSIERDIRKEKEKEEKKEKLREEYYAKKKEKMKKVAEKVHAREEKGERRRRKEEHYYNKGAIL